MKTDGKHSELHACSCGRDGRRMLDRRRFLAVGSGCVLGALGGAKAEAAEKAAAVDIGKLKDFAEDGISEAFTKHDFFVIRHDGHLFAVSTVCPHKGNVLSRDPDDSSRLVCEGHGSAFDVSGKVMVGPASAGLVRLGISVNAEGHVLVHPGDEFPEDNWADKQSFLDVQ